MKRFSLRISVYIVGFFCSGLSTFSLLRISAFAIEPKAAKPIMRPVTKPMAKTKIVRRIKIDGCWSMQEVYHPHTVLSMLRRKATSEALYVKYDEKF